MEMNYDELIYEKGCKNYNQYIDNYIKLVENGTIETCIEQKLLVKLVKKILLTEELFISDEQIEKYFSYQKYFPFDLFDWEKFVFILHNCVFRKDGLPRWPDLFILGGRGLGKNGYLSFEDFCLITPTNGIREYHIDISANSEEQAKITFEEIYNVLENSPYTNKLKKFFDWTQTRIKNKQTNSIIRYRTNNPKGKDGLRPGKVDFDEPHQYENWDNINVFTTALGKKPHPRRTYVSTNGEVRDGPLDNLIEKGEMILREEMKDNGFLPFICKLDNEKEVDNPKNWVKANPSLPFLPSLMEQMLKEYDDYKINPIVNSSFMTKRMNIPKESNELAVVPKEDIVETNKPIPILDGNKCIACFDLMKKNDFLAAGLLFKKDGFYYFITHTWVCKQSDDWHRIRAPLKEWEAMELLTIIDDTEIDPKVATDWMLNEVNLHNYHISGVAADSYKYYLIKNELNLAGLTEVKEIRPSDIMRNAPLIQSALKSHKVICGNNPLFRWAINNTKMVPAINNNFKFEKIEKKSRKNDPFMAFVHGFCLSEEVSIESSELIFMDTLVY